MAKTSYGYKSQDIKASSKPHSAPIIGSENTQNTRNIGSGDIFIGAMDRQNTCGKAYFPSCSSSVTRQATSILWNDWRDISPNILVKEKLQELFGFKSHHTLGNYLSYLTQTYLICKVNKYSTKSKERSIAEKVYAIDVAFMNKRENALAGENLGWRLETIVYLELRRRIKSEEEDIYYFNNGNTEADFIVCEGNRVIRIYQVAYDIENAKTRRREINGAIAAAQNTQCPNVYILTDHQSETIVHADITIKVLPVWEWIVRDDS